MAKQALLNALGLLGLLLHVVQAATQIVLITYKTEADSKCSNYLSNNEPTPTVATSVEKLKELLTSPDSPANAAAVAPIRAHVLATLAEKISFASSEADHNAVRGALVPFGILHLSPRGFTDIVHLQLATGPSDKDVEYRVAIQAEGKQDIVNRAGASTVKIEAEFLSATKIEIMKLPSEVILSWAIEVLKAHPCVNSAEEDSTRVAF